MAALDPEPGLRLARLDTPGMEWCRSMRTASAAHVLVRSRDRPASSPTRFAATTLAHPGATVEMEDWSGRRRLVLRVDARGRWFAGRRELDWAQGLIDVDLGVTPSTNTLPIRRLRLAVGASAELTAVWVRFPSLESPSAGAALHPPGLDSTYRYQSLVDGKVRFSARISVDRDGAVHRYAGLFQRLG